MELKTTEFKKDDILCLQETTTKEIFVLKSGEIDVVLNNEIEITEDAVKETGRIVKTINEPEQVIGELAAILNKPRSASLIAKTNCNVDVIDLKDISLSKVMSKNHKLGSIILNTIIERTYELGHLINNMAETIKSNIDFYIKYYESLKKINIEDETYNNKLNALNDLNDMTLSLIIEFYDNSINNFNELKKVKLEENNVLKAGTFIYDSTAQTDDLMLILNGKIEVYNNFIKILEFDYDKNIIAGDFNFLSKKDICTTFSFVATEPCKVKVIKRNQLKELLVAKPVLYGHISRLLSELLINSDKVYSQLEKNYLKINDALIGKENSLNECYNVLKDKVKEDEDKKIVEGFFKEVDAFKNEE